MSRAIALAERGRGGTSPNPMVGALVVDRDGAVVGRGFHEIAGGPHAEVRALATAGDDARGATLYCTLEPCCHVGRTGPCAPLVADAGIERVVIAIQDPNPLVAGGGIAYLRERGIVVSVGVCAEEAVRQNRAFVTRVTRRRPFVTLKAAVSMDDRIAEGAGVRTPLTGSAANRAIHRQRAEIDAIAVGSETIRVDDPLLTARGVYRSRPLTRVIFDRRLRTSPGARVLSTLSAGPVIIVSTPSAIDADPDRARALQAAGARLDAVAADNVITTALTRFAEQGMTSVLVEGGATLHEAFWTAGVVDSVEIYVTPRVLGPAGVPWLPVPVIGSGRLTDVTAVPVGDDVRIEANVYRPD